MTAEQIIAMAWLNGASALQLAKKWDIGTGDVKAAVREHGDRLTPSEMQQDAIANYEEACRAMREGGK